MPRFSVIEQQVAATAPRVDTGATLQGAALSDLGRAVTGVGEMLAKKELRDREVSLLEELNSASVDWAEKEKEYLRDRPDGKGIVDQFDEDWKTFSTNMVKDHKHPDTELRLSDMHRSLKTRMIEKQSIAKAQHEVTTFKSNRDLTASKVAKGEMDGALALDLLNAQVYVMSESNTSVRGALIQENEDIVGSAEIKDILEVEGFIAADDALQSKEYDIVSPGLRDSLKGQIRNQAGVHVRRETKDAVEMFSAGYPVGNLEEDIAIADRFGYVDQKEQMELVQKLGPEVTGLVRNTLTSAVSTIQALDAALLRGEGGPDDIARLQSYQTAVNSKAKALNTDPYPWMERSGWWEAPIPAGDPTQDMSEQLEQRRGIQLSAKSREGIDVPLLMPGEVQAFIDGIEQSAPEDKVRLIANLTQQLETDEIGGVATQIAKKDSTLAVAMVNAPFAPDVTRDIVLGRTRDVPLPEEQEIKLEFLKVTQQAIEDETARQQAMDAVKAVYKEYVFRNPKEADAFDPDAYKTAIERVVGPVVSSGGEATLSFRDRSGLYLNEVMFDNLTDSVTSDILRDTHGEVPVDIAGRELDLDKMFDRMRLVPVGDGLYYIRNNIGQHALTSAGRPYELNLKAIHAYRGGQ